MASCSAAVDDGTSSVSSFLHILLKIFLFDALRSLNLVPYLYSRLYHLSCVRHPPATRYIIPLLNIVTVLYTFPSFVNKELHRQHFGASSGADGLCSIIKDCTLLYNFLLCIFFDIRKIIFLFILLQKKNCVVRHISNRLKKKVNQKCQSFFFN